MPGRKVFLCDELSAGPKGQDQKHREEPDGLNIYQIALVRERAICFRFHLSQILTVSQSYIIIPTDII